MSGYYSIPISGLKEGQHRFDFEIGNEFFESFEDWEIEEGSLVADVVLEKRSSHIDLTVRLSGSVMICCDRCLELFPFPVKCENRLLVKFSKVIEEIDPDILIIAPDEHELDLSQYLYEYIHLALPIRRIHPNDKDGRSTCDPEMIKKLKEHIIEKENENDPRWDGLKKLMNKN